MQFLNRFVPFWSLFLGGIFLSHIACAQRLQVPAVHSNMEMKNGKLVLQYKGQDIPESVNPTWISLEAMQGKPKGTIVGIDFDFGNPEFEGSLIWGFVPYGDSRHPHPIYRRRNPIQKGKASLDIVNTMKTPYDMIGWQEKERGTVGYRILSRNGVILYDGIISFTGKGPFKIDDTVIEGPFVNLLTDSGATISFETNRKVKAAVVVDGKRFAEEKASTHHEIAITGLNPNQSYEYQIDCGPEDLRFSFKTAPKAGSRQAFTFAYASDSRSALGGGERDMYGANGYIMKKIMALARSRDAAFMQFSGDMIDGYLTNLGEMNLQYANWKRAIQPFTHYFPVYVSMGNHEAFMRVFTSEEGYRFQVNRFPYESESGEAVFARHFVMPTNGPQSEDGASYDPDPKKIDFPSYRENVFTYGHDNVAVVVLNSDYWYAPSTPAIPLTSGGVHGYLMDQQIEWLSKTLDSLEADDHVDHIFVTQHTPAFPNGGHIRDDMWYNGNNQIRPFVAGKPLQKGIIQRRDEYLDLLINKSQKVVAILTGDEHNYARTSVGPETTIYPEVYAGEKVELNRRIWQINNGAAGAPYYAQEETPWTPMVEGFTTQHALVLFHINGKSIEVEVVNPDTLEPVDSFTLR